MVISIKIKRCLKRDGDIGSKAELSDVKTALACTPALTVLCVHLRWCGMYLSNITVVFCSPDI